MSKRSPAASGTAACALRLSAGPRSGRLRSWDRAAKRTRFVRRTKKSRLWHKRVLPDPLVFLALGIGAIVWSGLAWLGIYRGWINNVVTKTTIFAGVPVGVGFTLGAAVDMLSLRGRVLGYLIAGCFLVGFIFLLITPDPLGPTWYRQLQKKSRHQNPPG